MHRKPKAVSGTIPQNAYEPEHRAEQIVKYRHPPERQRDSDNMNNQRFRRSPPCQLIKGGVPPGNGRASETGRLQRRQPFSPCELLQDGQTFRRNIRVVEIESESQSQKTRPICNECIQNKQKSRHFVTQLRAVPPSVFHASVPLSNVHLPDSNQQQQTVPVFPEISSLGFLPHFRKPSDGRAGPKKAHFPLPGLTSTSSNI